MDSILNSIKRVVGVEIDDDAFDVDIIMFINTAFSTLNQLGIGPTNGFFLEDETAVWSDYLDDDPNLNSVKAYVGLRVRTLFDPPSTSFHLESMNKQIEELGWRLNAYRENRDHPYIPVVVVVVEDPL